MIKLKFICNTAILDIVNNGTETMIFRPEEMLGIVDLRLLGYYKIKQGILLYNILLYRITIFRNKQYTKIRLEIFFLLYKYVSKSS